MDLLASFVLFHSKMISRVYGAALQGIEPYLVQVETDVQRGLPKFDIVGLAQNAVMEGRNRILSAIKNSGIEWSPRRVTVNLAPAAIRKDGATFDLTIALGLLAAMGSISQEVLEKKLFLGELSLDGTLRPVRGGYALADYASSLGWQEVILPFNSDVKREDFQKVIIRTPKTFAELLAHLRGGVESLMHSSVEEHPLENDVRSGDFSDVRGQERAKRALEIAAAGHHNVLLSGPPGVGKTLLAKRFAGILPLLEGSELREVRLVYSASGRQFPSGAEAPFRAPQHHASLGGFVGGGNPFRPGELSLAHRGLLFMDELPEFRRDLIEALREPLEHGMVSVCRQSGVFLLPARFMFIGAMNLCPCGATGDPRKFCFCSPPAMTRYRNKVSGPIRDRIDIHTELVRPKWSEIWESTELESSDRVRERVIQARAVQRLRYRAASAWNGNVESTAVRETAKLDSEGENLLLQGMERFALSARGFDKVLRVSRTIADLDSAERISAAHVAEALQFRCHES